MSKHRKKRSNVSHKDIQISYLVDGIESINKLYQEGRITNIAIKKAFNGFKENNRNVAVFEKWVHENIPVDVRGRKGPRSGQERTYRAQQINGSTPFLRLPVETLQVDKGHVLSVLFQKDQIVIKRL